MSIYFVPIYAFTLIYLSLFSLLITPLTVFVTTAIYKIFMILYAIHMCTTSTVWSMTGRVSFIFLLYDGRAENHPLSSSTSTFAMLSTHTERKTRLYPWDTDRKRNRPPGISTVCLTYDPGCWVKETDSLKACRC